jgi:plasmid replication initiation protein
MALTFSSLRCASTRALRTFTSLAKARSAYMCYNARQIMSSELLSLQAEHATVTQANLLARAANEHLTLYENRLIYLIMAAIPGRQASFSEAEIAVADLKRLLGVHSKAIYKLTEDTVLSLRERRVTIGSDREGWFSAPWFQDVAYIPAHKHAMRTSTVKLTFHNDLRAYLLRPMLEQEKLQYNTMSLKELLNIPTYTSARLFEVLFHDSFGARKTPLIYDIDDLKKRLGIVGKYPKFADFRYILDRGMQDLKAWTRIEYEYAGIRHGLAYDQVRFDVKHNLTYRPEFSEVAIEEDVDSLAKHLKLMGYIGDAHQAVEKYGTERVRRNLLVAQKHIADAFRGAQPIKDPGWLISYMIEHNSAERQTHDQARAREGLNAQQMQEIAAVLETNYEAEVREISNVLIKEMSDTELERLHNLMRAELDRLTLTQLYRHNWTGAVYEAAVSSVIYQKQRFLLPARFQTFAAWATYEGLLSAFSLEEQGEIIRLATNRLAL